MLTRAARGLSLKRTWLATPSYFFEQRREFRLEQNFVRQYDGVKPEFGFNGLGELVYYRTYARVKEDGGKECWQETIERVVNGLFSMQERWFAQNDLEWEEQKIQDLAQEMYSRIFHMKFLPPGRSLWAMGTAVTEERGLFAALNNCAFVSTQDIAVDPSAPFCFTMDSSMLGVGVGFDTAGAGKITVLKPSTEEIHISIADSREGWVDSLKALIDSYTKHDGETRNPTVRFSYDKIRPAGLPIKGFGGSSSGPEPLRELHEAIRRSLDIVDGKPITVTAIVDVMNLVGRCVVAGNVRRTAEIAFGDPESKEYIELKDYAVNPHRMDYGWTSNNSVFAKLGMDYEQTVKHVRVNGEPGFAWLKNMQEYGRMGDPKNNKDYRARGGNPCLEQTLEPYELCCLVETFPARHDNLEDFKKTLELAFLYGKIVTLGRTHWPQSNRVMLRNRRIGCSMSGIAQFVAKNGVESLKEWSDEGYQHIQQCDENYSQWLAIPKSIKTTCIKPSGTVSLLAGATPGVHYPESRYYIRRVRLSTDSELIQPLIDAGFDVEPAVTDPEGTVVVSVPIDIGEGVRTVKDVSMWEQLSMAAFMQRHWADNQVSCTVTFDPKTEGVSLKTALDFFQYQLKGISFLPKMETGAYAQMPYEEMNEEQYKEMASKIRNLDLTALYGHQHQELESFAALSNDDGVSLVAGTSLMPDSFCDSGTCQSAS